MMRLRPQVDLNRLVDWLNQNYSFISRENYLKTKQEGYLEKKFKVMTKGK